MCRLLGAHLQNNCNMYVTQPELSILNHFQNNSNRNIPPGYYLYLHVDQNRSASFSSPLISAPKESRCVEFYYHMHGLDQGRLDLYVRYGDGSRDLVWQRNGPQGNTWRRGFLNIKPELFQLQFQGTGTKGFRDYMAIDDIRIADCARFGKLDF